MKPKPPSCIGCPAYEWGLSFVRPEGPLTASVAVVGQGPGEVEAEYGRPFIGPSGRMLDGWLQEQRSKVWVGNLVWCWLPERKNEAGRGVGNRPPTKAEAAYCYQQHLGPALRELSPDVHLLPTGAEAVRFLYGLGADQPIEPYLGTTMLVELPELEDAT